MVVSVWLAVAHRTWSVLLIWLWQWWVFCWDCMCGHMFRSLGSPQGHRLCWSSLCNKAVCSSKAHVFFFLLGHGFLLGQGCAWGPVTPAREARGHLNVNKVNGGKCVVSLDCCQFALVVSISVRPHRRQLPWDSPGKNTGVGCHFLLQCTRMKSESEVAQSCLTFSDPMDCSLPGSSPANILRVNVFTVIISYGVCHLNFE